MCNWAETSPIANPDELSRHDNTSHHHLNKPNGSGSGLLVRVRLSDKDREPENPQQPTLASASNKLLVQCRIDRHHRMDRKGGCIDRVELISPGSKWLWEIVDDDRSFPQSSPYYSLPPAMASLVGYTLSI